MSPYVDDLPSILDDYGLSVLDVDQLEKYGFDGFGNSVIHLAHVIFEQIKKQRITPFYDGHHEQAKAFENLISKDKREQIDGYFSKVVDITNIAYRGFTANAVTGSHIEKYTLSNGLLAYLEIFLIKGRIIEVKELLFQKT